MTTWRLLTESGDYLITEAGEQYINETIASDLAAESIVTADLKVVAGFAADLVCESVVNAELLTSIQVAASLEAISSCDAGLTSSIRLAANLSVESNVTADIESKTRFNADLVASPSLAAEISTEILASAELEALSDSSANLTTSVLLAADLSADTEVISGLSTSIKLNAGLVAQASVESVLTTATRVSANLTSQSSVTAEVIFFRPLYANLDCASSVIADIKTATRINASLNCASVVTANLETSVNAIAALVAIANVATANLKVIRRPARYPDRAKYLYLAEIEAYDPATSSTITWRFSTGKGYDNAGTFYKPRIEQPASIQRSLSSILGGKTSTSYGELTLINNDGELNALADDFFDGRTVTIKRGKRTDPYNNFTTILKASAEVAAMERERVSVRLRDRSYLLEKPFSTAKYAGSNVLPAGLEGTADDIKGQSKPRIFGRIALMAPVLVNTAKLIYQVNDGAVDAVINVFDSGAYLDRGTDYASEADMLANAPAGGEWKAYPAGGYFRIGSTPFGQLGACVAESWDYLDNTAAGIIQRLLTEAGYTSSDWVAADFTTLNQKNAGSLGLIVQDSETTASLIDRICESVGAWWGVDNLNRFRFGRLDAPAGASVALITDDEIIDIERETDAKPAIWQETIKADENYLVLDKKNLAGVVTDARAAWFATQTRDQSSEDATVKTERLLAEAETEQTYMNGIAIAKAEADRRLDLFSSRRDTVNVTIAPASEYGTIDLGDVVTITSSQLGYTSGRQMVVTSIRPDYQANQIDVRLWG